METRSRRFSLRAALAGWLHGLADRLTGTPAFETDGTAMGATFRTVGASTKTKLVPFELRRRGYDRAREAADRHGVTLSVCSCKNPDIEGALCVSGLGVGPSNRVGKGRQLSLLE